MNNYKTVVEFPVHWGECDMLGHVNHTRFLVWMETARITLFDRVGLVTQDAPEFGPILANISVNYRAPVKFPSTVVCGTRVSRIGRTSFSMEYGLWLADEPNALVADATAVIPFAMPFQSPFPARRPTIYQPMMKAIVAL